jgi:hypothetical protein
MTYTVHLSVSPEDKREGFAAKSKGDAMREAIRLANHGFPIKILEWDGDTLNAVLSPSGEITEKRVPTL